MVHRFTKELWLDLRKVLLEMAPTTFSVTIETAIRIEGENIEYAKMKENEGQRFFTQKRFSQSQWQKNKIPGQEKFVVPRNPIVVERKNIRLINVINYSGSLNAKEGIQDFPIRTQG
jgi:hypothetical protein